MRKLLIAALASIAMTGTAFAQAQSGSNSNSQSGSAAQSSSGVSISSYSKGVKQKHYAPSVVAPGLAAAGIETCLGSASGGVSFPGGGFSFGSTTKDKDCNLRLYSRTLWSYGYRQPAVKILCQSPEVYVAMTGVCQHEGVRPPRGVKFVEHPDYRGVASVQPARHSNREAVAVVTPHHVYRHPAWAWDNNR